MRLFSLLILNLTILSAQRAAYISPGRAAELSNPDARSAQEIGIAFLTNSSGLSPADLSGVYLAKEFQSAHNGVTHLRYRQRFQGFEVSNATWAVNIAADGEVLSAGGTLYTAPGLVSTVAAGSSLQAVRAAVRAVNPALAETYAPLQTVAPAREAVSADRVRFAAGDLGADVDGRLVWYGVRGTLQLAWELFVMDSDHASAYMVAVEAGSGAVLDKQPMSFFQSAPTGLVFDKGSPQPTVPGVRATEAPPLVERVSIPFTGDPIASPLGWTNGTETSGNNTTTGINPLGLSPYIPVPTKAVGGAFNFPLQLGPGAPSPVVFSDAAATNLFYWVNRAHDLHYRYGFDEASGNFQESNVGRGGVGGDPMRAYAEFAAAGLFSPALRNAFFTTFTNGDGGESLIAMYAGYSNMGGFFTDASYDAEVIVHEYTHGVSTRLVENGYTTFQGRSMGEAWSDFYALEYLTPDGAPVDGVYGAAQYYFQSFGSGLRTHPFSTDLNVNPLTYAQLGKVLLTGPEVHADGEIWVEALWEARASLIRQFGEPEGRRRIRQLVMDGMKLSVPAPSMVDARDAILLADRVDFKGESQSQLWAAFAKRGLGVLAYSPDGVSVHIVPSFDLPSATGKLKFYEDTFVVGEQVRVLLADSNCSQPTVRIQLTSSAGDLEDLVLRRDGSVYFGAIATSGNLVARQNLTLNIGTFNAISAYYVDLDPASGAASLVQATANTQLPYALTTSPQFFSFPGERRILTSPAPLAFDLPFEFPFFSQKYRRVVILPTGALQFEPSAGTSLASSGCPDIVEFRRMVGIAPLLHGLTFGSSQPSEGVYVSTSVPGLITFRWAAETMTAFSPNNGDPVNFLVTLTQDGLIQFQYGSGNSNLQTAAVSSACAAGPTVGLSNGHDVYARTVTARSYTNAPTFRFDPPFNHSSDPVIRLEKPAQSDTTAEILTVSGVAYDPQSSVSRVEIFVDDVMRAVTGASISRADVCGAQNVPGCPFVGFLTNIGLAAAQIPAGLHTVWARATNTRGGFSSTEKVSITTQSAGRQPKGAVEVPAQDSQVSGILSVSGYAYLDDLRILAADTLIDGVTYPGTSYGLSRTAICNGLRPTPVACPGIGFLNLIDTKTGIPPLADGAHTLQIRVYDETGRFTILNPQGVSFTVKNGTQPVPTGALMAPASNATLSGIVDIAGYGYSPTGRVILVSVLVDGSTVATARYGTPAPDACADLKGVAACPNIGFTGTLDTRAYNNGPHVLGVRITNDTGISVIVPMLDRSGMNVTFQN